jgi:uncharacterized glyoxalase superfamily protein PhnB
MTPVLGSVDLIVNDVSATVTFLRQLGIDIPDDSVWAPEGRAHHVSVVMPNGMHMDLSSRELARAYDPTDGGNCLIFLVPTREAVDELYADVTGAGYATHLEPFDAFWGARYAIVLDPDNNKVGIMSPQDQEHAAAPPL